MSDIMRTRTLSGNPPGAAIDHVHLHVAVKVHVYDHVNVYVDEKSAR